MQPTIALRDAIVATIILSPAFITGLTLPGDFQNGLAARSPALSGNAHHAYVYEVRGTKTTDEQQDSKSDDTESGSKNGTKDSPKKGSKSGTKTGSQGDSKTTGSPRTKSGPKTKTKTKSGTGPKPTGAPKVDARGMPKEAGFDASPFSFPTTGLTQPTGSFSKPTGGFPLPTGFPKPSGGFSDLKGGDGCSAGPLPTGGASPFGKGIPMYQAKGRKAGKVSMPTMSMGPTGCGGFGPGPTGKATPTSAPGWSW